MMQNSESSPKPFSKERTKIIVCKIIFFYSIFYVVMKVLAIFQGAWIDANLILSLPFAVLGGIGFYNEKRKNYSWLYVVIGVGIISFIRYYETDLMVWLHNSV